MFWIDIQDKKEAPVQTGFRVKEKLSRNQECVVAAHIKKRKLGIPTANAGEYFAIGELLRRGFDAQLADRNTRGYDMLVGSSEEERGVGPTKIQIVRKARYEDYP